MPHKKILVQIFRTSHSGALETNIDASISTSLYSCEVIPSLAPLLCVRECQTKNKVGRFNASS